MCNVQRQHRIVSTYRVPVALTGFLAPLAQLKLQKATIASSNVYLIILHQL
jgi:hypothetical protein